MEKDTHPISKQENTTICEKLIRVIHTTTPFRATRFGSNNKVYEETPFKPSSNISLMTRTPLRDRNTRISNQPTPFIDRCPRRPVENKKEHETIVPIVFRQSEDQSNGSGRKNNVSFAPSQPTSRNNKPKEAFLPIHGIDHRVPSMSHIDENSSIAESINGLFTEFIDRAGRKIRSPTMMSGTSMGNDSFDDKASDFINRAKNKFHNTPSLVDSSFKEKRIK